MVQAQQGLCERHYSSTQNDSHNWETGLQNQVSKVQNQQRTPKPRHRKSKSTNQSTGS